MSITVRSIYGYLIKGLSPEALTQVMFSAGQGIPNDRLVVLKQRRIRRPLNVTWTFPASCKRHPDTTIRALMQKWLRMALWRPVI